MNTAALAVDNLKTWLDGSGGTVRALDGVGFEIRRGETFAIVGESGCGKSMTALSILRLLPDSGRIVDGSVSLDGQELLTLPEAAMRNVRGRRIAMIFQEPATSLNPVMTVGAQIGEVLTRHFDMQGGAARTRSIELLDAVGIPAPKQRIDEYPFQLSGGMKQRVMIALALGAEPDLLIADEPTTALDVTIQAQVLDLLRDLQRRRGTSILLITHDLGIVATMAQRVAVMYAGHMVEIADTKEFFRAPQHPYSRKLFAALPGVHNRGGTLATIRGQVPPLTKSFAGCRFADRCDFAWQRCRDETPAWTPIAASHAVRCHLREREPAGPVEADPESAMTRLTADEGAACLAAPPPLLRVRDLQVYFPVRRGLLKRTVGFVRAVDGISLDIAEGSTLALVGESGCGKTTAGKAIVRLLKPTAGSVEFAGFELAGLNEDRLAPMRGDFQIIFQDPFSSLNPRMRIADILREGMSSLRVYPDDAARARRLDELLDQVGLPASAKSRYPHEFSGGQRQRIAIARALAVNPRLIVCDEPTSALDVSVQAQILNLLLELQRELGLAYLFITHNIAVVEHMAHQVAVMYLGRIIEEGRSEEVLRSPQHPYTRALLAAVPRLDGIDQRVKLQGEMPSPMSPPAGCHFHPRCPYAREECRAEFPAAIAASPTHRAACVLLKRSG